VADELYRSARRFRVFAAVPAALGWERVMDVVWAGP
jgi:hypothetical protein